MPATAPAAAVIVSDEAVPVVGDETNAAVTPAGRPSTVSVTGAVKLVRPMLMLRTSFAPLATVSVAGVADNVKPVPAVTVSASGAVTAVMPVPVARIVTLLVPTGVVPVVVSCNDVVVPVPVLGFGVKVAVTPAGRFSAAKVTLPVKFVRARAMLVVEFAF